MKKLLISLGLILIVFIIIINIPFEEKVNNNLEKRDILVAYSQGLGIGGIASVSIYENGTIEYFSNKIGTKQLNPEELNKLKNAINNNQFSVSKISTWTKWRSKFPDCADCYTGIEIIINKNGQAIKIKLDGVIWDIISRQKLF